MKRWGGLLLLPLVVILGCRLARNNWNRPPALLEAPVEPKPKPAPPANLRADNSRCHVCHLNYADEKLALTHEHIGIGCEKCHGMSDDHCGSEEHTVPPDTMFPRDKINAFCIHCHKPEKLTGDVAHAPFLAKKPRTAEVCTGCHGTHRLARRIRKWDKITGKLLEAK